MTNLHSDWLVVRWVRALIAMRAVRGIATSLCYCCVSPPRRRSAAQRSADLLIYSVRPPRRGKCNNTCLRRCKRRSGARRGGGGGGVSSRRWRGDSRLAMCHTVLSELHIYLTGSRDDGGSRRVKTYVLAGCLEPVALPLCRLPGRGGRAVLCCIPRVQVTANKVPGSYIFQSP